MSASILKRSREDIKGGFKPKKRQRKIKKQLEYHSSSEDENEAITSTDFNPVNLQDSDESGGEHPIKPQKIAFTAAEGNASETEDDSAQSAESDETGASSGNEAEDSDADVTASAVKKRKRNDPNVFATSMSKI